MKKNWLINVSDEQDMINGTLDNGKNLKQLIIGVLVCSLHYKLLGKVKNMLNSD